VLVDNALGARMAAEHLLDLGHTRVAVVTGPQSLTTGRERLRGFRAALEARELTLSPDYIEISNFREAGGYSAVVRLLALSEPPTAFFVANNEMMAGALSALRERGLRIPEEVSLISFDDVRWARYVQPPLTVIAQPTEQIGTLAAGLLFERLSGRQEAIHYLLKPELVRRASCAPPVGAASGSRYQPGVVATSATASDPGEEAL
jgi:LacI family transcriptional regulator